MYTIRNRTGVGAFSQKSFPEAERTQVFSLFPYLFKPERFWLQASIFFAR
jgi:hypothetical protein